MTTFAISTLGCKVNTYESNSYSCSLKENGLVEVDFKEKADVYIINTCTVTNTAASKSRQKIHQAIKQNENALICVVGCLVQTSLDEIQDSNRIDVLIGASGKKYVAQYIMEALKERKKTVEVSDVRTQATFEALPIERFSHQKRAFLKVQDGCNQFCSYCIIPYARGKERSLPMSEVIAQAQQLVRHGHKELVLSGIHTGRYGNDKDETLTKLLYQLVEIQGLERIRISSIEMNEITDEMLDLMATNDKLAKHLHIPLQSGCDTILKAMNRHYTTSMFKKRLMEIRNKIKDIAIGTDVIVGFPTESDDLFKETYHFLQEMKFTYLHVFPYSVRKNTVAETLKPQVENSVKKERVKLLISQADAFLEVIQQNKVNQTLSVLIEQEKDGYTFGHSSEYLPIYVDGGIIGNIEDVVVTHLKNGKLYGRLKGQ